MKTDCPKTRIQTAVPEYLRVNPLVLAIFGMASWNAAPTLAADGGQIVHGQGTIQAQQNLTTINQQSNALIVNWQNFNIAPSERVQFLQPSSSSIVLNRVLANDPTAILGQLVANGQVFLLNPNGITFGANAQVNVGGLVASTLNISNAEFLSGASTGQFTFNGAGNGRIVNQGSIKTPDGGYIALLAKQVSNQGTINTPQGTTALAAGARVTLSQVNGLLNISVDAAVLDALVENKHAIHADGGQVILSAQARDALLNNVVNQTGIIEARSIEKKNGRVFLSGGNSGVVNVAGTIDVSGKSAQQRGGEVKVTGANIAINKQATIDASGAAAGGRVLIGGEFQGGGDTPRAKALWMDTTARIAANATQEGLGGEVVLWSDDATRAYGNISATGNQGGGLVETSGRFLDVEGITVDASSVSGPAGLWLLDPNNISIQTTGANTNITGSPNFTTTNNSAIITTATIQSALNAGGGTSVAISTGAAGTNSQPGNITFATNSRINYSGTNAGVGLTINAHNNIVANTGTAITATAGALDVTFNAGRQASGNGVMTLTTTSIVSNGGRITLNGAPNGGGASGARGILLTGSTLNAAGGDIALTAIGGTTGTNTNRGVEISGSTLNTTGVGTIALNGTGGSRANNYGVLLTGTTRLQTQNGAVTIIGRAGNASTATGIGVLSDATSRIVTTAGNISVTGTGSSAATATNNNGVQLSTANGISSTTGNIQITGTSGTGRGTDVGVRLLGATPITTGGNTITISGTSVSSGATTGNVGVAITAASVITNSNAAGRIDITGTGGGGTGTNRFGVNIAGSTVRATAGGSINITGVGGGRFAGINAAATNPVIGVAATRDVTLTASNGGGGDALALATGTRLQGTGTLTVQGPTAATIMGIGGAASAAFNVQMNTTELGFIQAGFADIVFGRSNGTGAITVGAGSTNANTTIQGNTSNFTINGAFATTGSRLTLSTGGTVTESGVGALTVNGGAGTLQLQNGGVFNLTNNNNTGTLNANGASLNFRDDSGFVVSGINTTGNITLSTANNVTQTGAILTPGALNLNGAGGVYNLCTQSNDIATLNANTHTIAFNDVNTYALGTLNLTGALELAGDFGTSGNITTSSFLFDAPSRNVTFTNSGTIGTLAANVAGLNYSQANSITIGSVTNAFCNPGTVNGIRSSGNVTLTSTAANSDISLATNAPIAFIGAAPGTITLNAQRNIVMNTGSSIASSGQPIGVTFNANRQGAVAGGGAILLTSATITSNNGTITLAGDPSGTGFASNQAGNGITLNAATLNAGTGAITLRGEGAGAANASGIALTNASTIQSSGGTISLTGKNADVSALANQTGVSIASNSSVVASGANDLAITGTSGAGIGAGNVGVRVQSGGRISALDGALIVNATSIGNGDQAIGLAVSGVNSEIRSTGIGTMNLLGQGGSGVSATNASGISISDTAGVLGEDGSSSIVGDGGTNSPGVQIDNATTGANGLGAFTVAGTGNGTAAGIATSGAQPTLLADQGGTLILEVSNGGSADAMVLAATTRIQGNGNLIVRGANVADTMGIGGVASAAHNLQIDQTELATIQLGLASITFGRGDGTGLITVADGSTNAATTIQSANANVDIIGTYSTFGADLTLNTAGIASESASNHALIVNGGAGTLNLRGGGTFNLCKGDNDVGTLTAIATELAFNDINDLTLGTPFTVTNDVALGVNGTLNAPSGINGGGLALFGSNVTFNNVGNVGKLAALVSGDLIYSQDNSYAIDSVNNACLGGAVNGISAGGNVNLSVGAGNTVSQSATGLIASNSLSLSGGRFSLTQANNINSLIANAEELALRDDDGFSVDSLLVSGATRLISNGGAVTQTGAIVSNGLALTGAGGTFNLSDSGNNITTLAIDSGDVRFASSSGFALGAVTTSVDSVTTSGVKANTVALTSNGVVTQDGDAPLQIGAGSGVLTLTGGTFQFAGVNNNVGTLIANGFALNFRDDDGFSVDGINMTGTACLLSDGDVTQSTAGIIADALGLGGSGNFVLNGSNNDVNTLAASGQSLVYRDVNGLDIGSVTPVGGSPKSGITVVSNVVLEAGGDVTQSAAISAAGLALTGTAANYLLTHSGNQVTTLAGNANRIEYSQGNSLLIGAVSGNEGINAADRVTLQTTGAAANLTIDSAVAAQGSSFAAVLSTQNDLINNVGAGAISTPNGNWAVYANNPNTSVFNGLTAPTNLFGNTIATLPPNALPTGANAIIFQSAAPVIPPPPPIIGTGLYRAGPAIVDFNVAETTHGDLLEEIGAADFLDVWRKFGYIPLEVVYGGIKLPDGLVMQDVALEKLRRRLGISGDRMHRYSWWR